ncbi:DUF4251 domain-containing protein [Mucilaginibacter litoreus]|uniref:DUF4251 domain-containing protein n=1 Tax=Mucilaginibacter litoreus TaxID=1048221 RepID=A0ABW3ASF2_9SPHI
MKKILSVILAFTLCTGVLQIANAQNTKAEKNAAKAAEMKTMLDSKKFTFIANYAYPGYGGQRYLTPNYDVKVSQDTVVSYLPFMGVAYMGAGYNNSEDAGIKFTSTNFSYDLTAKKNGMYYLVIKPIGVKNVNQMIFNIASTGYADLVVLSNNRERMRFTGLVQQTETKK